MDSQQLAIRSKLWQARCSRHKGISVAGGFRPYQHASEFIVGKKSNAKFHGMDATAAFAYFRSRRHVKVINYSPTMVDLAVATMANDSSQHIVGLTQENYNADDDYNEILDFQEHNDASFLVWQSTDAPTMTSHEILAPRLKELASIYEHNPDKLIEVAAILDQLIQKGKAENAAMRQKPVGHIVSALAPNNQTQHTHTKQKKHH